MIPYLADTTDDKNMFEQEEKENVDDKTICEDTTIWTHEDKNMSEQEEKETGDVKTISDTIKWTADDKNIF